MGYEFDNEYDFFEIQEAAEQDLSQLNKKQQTIYNWIKEFEEINSKGGYIIRDIENDDIFKEDIIEVMVERLRYQNDHFRYLIEQLEIKIEDIEHRYKTFSSVFRELFLK